MNLSSPLAFRAEAARAVEEAKMAITPELGLDMSLTSPGIVWRRGAYLALIMFQQRKREGTGSRRYGNVLVVVHPALPVDRYDRMRLIVSKITEWCDLETRVGIEGYSYGSFSSSVTVLAELGGYLRCTLKGKAVMWQEFSPNTVKKVGSKKGHADKAAMVDAFQAQLPAGVPRDLGLGCKPEQNPLSDVADAYAVMRCLSEAPAPKPKKKRQTLKQMQAEQDRLQQRKRKRDGSAT